MTTEQRAAGAAQRGGVFARLRRWAAERARRGRIRAFARRMLEREDRYLEDVGFSRYVLVRALEAPETFSGVGDIRRRSLEELRLPGASRARPAPARPRLRVITGGCASPRFAAGSADAYSACGRSR